MRAHTRAQKPTLTRTFHSISVNLLPHPAHATPSSGGGGAVTLTGVSTDAAAAANAGYDA
jgi:hypothetical protein